MYRPYRLDFSYTILIVLSYLVLTFRLSDICVPYLPHDHYLPVPLALRTLITKYKRYGRSGGWSWWTGWNCGYFFFLFLILSSVPAPRIVCHSRRLHRSASEGCGNTRELRCSQPNRHSEAWMCESTCKVVAYFSLSSTYLWYISTYPVSCYTFTSACIAPYNSSQYEVCKIRAILSGRIGRCHLSDDGRSTGCWNGEEFLSLCY